ncbi:hypothetical protein [Sphingosinicella sp. YJ22]|uniref:hypothetical protein n=1 Tax=Sphingosinicella sp. YJ22 TaxID=1104780 RepID=UPI00140E043C|nr:hypothetical protein [Sphingosinicella sp. YJ22]
MADPKSIEGTPTSADGVTERDPSIPASEEGTGIIPEDEGRGQGDTHVPASEADTSPVEGEEESPLQSWPGRGPGSIPPPG